MGQGPPGCRPCCARVKVDAEESFTSPLPSRLSKQAFEEPSCADADKIILGVDALKEKNGIKLDTDTLKENNEISVSKELVMDVAATTMKNIKTTFCIPFHRDEGSFGFEVDTDDGVALIISAVTGGQMQEWNSRQTEQVNPGDRIVSVNSRRGDPSELLQMMTDAIGKTLIEVKPHTEFSAALHKAPPDRLGVSLRHREHGNTLLVRAVKEDGLIASWNAANKGSEIVAGDRIVEVNQVRCDATRLDSMLNEDGELKLVLVRFDDNSP